MKNRNKLLIPLLFVAILSICISCVSAEETVDVGGNTFILPLYAQKGYTDANTCNFTVENFSGSIMKIDSNDLQDYIHSNRLKKYEVKMVSGDQKNLYRYEDRLHHENGVVTPLQKGGDSYIFKLYVYDSFSGSTKNKFSNDRVKYMAILRGFLSKNGYHQVINDFNPAI